MGYLFGDKLFKFRRHFFLLFIFFCFWIMHTKSKKKFVGKVYVENLRINTQKNYGTPDYNDGHDQSCQKMWFTSLFRIAYEIKLAV